MILLRTLLLLTLMAAAPSPPGDEPLPRRAYLGVRFAPVTGGGFEVDDVAAGWTGAAMGLRRGDRIIEVGGIAVVRLADVLANVDRVKAGRRITMTIVRDGRRKTVAGWPDRGR